LNTESYQYDATRQVGTMERQEAPDKEQLGAAQRAACEDCDWYHRQINRAAGDPEPCADLEALFGAHLRRKHAGPAPRRSV
jgi:hypothetical protein